MRLVFGASHINGNLARLGFFGFGDADIQDAIVKVCLDSIPADIDWEAQAAGELAAAAFAD